MNILKTINLILNIIALVYGAYLILKSTKQKIPFSEFLEKNNKEIFTYLLFACFTLGYNLLLTILKIS